MLLREGSENAKREAAYALGKLCANSEEWKAQIANAGALPALISLLQEGPDASKGGIRAEESGLQQQGFE